MRLDYSAYVLDDHKMEESNNPAARLLSLLGRVDGVPHNVPILDGWGKVFSIDPPESTAVFSRLILVGRLVDEVEAAVKASTIRNKELYLRHLPKIRVQLLHENLLAQWTNVKTHIPAQGITDLEHCSDRLSEMEMEKQVPEDDLAGIKSMVGELFDSIRNSDLDDQLKTTLLDLLEGIRQLVAQYEIRGVAALREALESSFGKLIAVRESLARPENKGIRDRLVSVLVKLDTVCSKASKYIPLLEKGTKTFLFLYEHTTGH